MASTILDMADTEQGDVTDWLVAVTPMQPVEVHWPAEIDWVDGANMFDANKIKADADGFALSDDYKGVDVAAIQAAL